MPHDHGHPARDDRARGHAGDAAPPVLVEVARGAMVESVHRGRAVVADRQGHVAAHWGVVDAPVFPRSAIKPIQAIPLIESGAADALGLSDEEIALACASHNGEPAHTDRVAAWLARMGLSETELACGPQAPRKHRDRAALEAAGRQPGRIHNNCSGKHAGMLATARHKGEPTAGYHRLTHPVQQRVLGVLEQMSGQDLGPAPRGVDGCSIPTIATSLGGLAVAMARFADPADLPDRRIEAVLRIRRAWAGQPYMIAGRGRFDTALIETTGGRVLVKTGAEGAYCASLPALGLGLALKIEDGAGRASAVALTAVLQRLGALEAGEVAALAARARPPVANWAGEEVGEIRPAPGLAP
jgi:L-asparaginase II